MPLELAFDTKYLRDICENARNAERALGIQCARALGDCLADFYACADAQEFIEIADAVPTHDDGLKVVLTDGKELVFLVNHTRLTPVNGSVDWSKVVRMKLVKLEDSHVDA